MVTQERLPDYKAKFLTVEELHARVAAGSCGGESNAALTLIDLRTEHHLATIPRPPIIKTACPTIFCLLDDLQKKEIRNQIPKKGVVVTITETGNRDKFAMQFLSKYGYKNIHGLLFGMRGWIKAGYETETP